MKNWAKTRAWSLQLLVQVVALLLVAIWGSRVIVVPAVFGGGSSTFGIASFCPLLLACCLAYSMDARHHPIETRALRGVRLLDGALLVTVIGAFSSGVTLMNQFARVESSELIIRNTMILCGLAVGVTCFSSASTAAVFVSALLLLTTSYAPYNPGDTYVRFLQPEADAIFGRVLAGGLVILAAASLRLASRRETPALVDA